MNNESGIMNNGIKAEKKYESFMKGEER